MNQSQAVCKVCGKSSQPKHTVEGITYFYCPSCHFLQNYYWETKNINDDSSQTDTNEDWLQKHWLPAESDHDHAKGWELLQLLAWPPAWHARQLNNRLLQLPVYDRTMRRYVKHRLHRLMDFGCGYGNILKELAQRDNFDIIGVDPYAPQPNNRVLQEDLMTVDLPPASFDAIFSIETLEHIINPVDIFKKLNQLIKPNGTLLVQTRRQEDPDYPKLQDKWFYLNPRIHVSIYSIPTMKFIAKKTGWRDVQFKGAKYARFRK